MPRELLPPVQEVVIDGVLVNLMDAVLEVAFSDVDPETINVLLGEPNIIRGTE